jgi:hypothetical protein
MNIGHVSQFRDPCWCGGGGAEALGGEGVRGGVRGGMRAWGGMGCNGVHCDHGWASHEPKVTLRTSKKFVICALSKGKHTATEYCMTQIWGNQRKAKICSLTLKKGRASLIEASASH